MLDCETAAKSPSGLVDIAISATRRGTFRLVYLHGCEMKLSDAVLMNSYSPSLITANLVIKEKQIARKM